MSALLQILSRTPLWVWGVVVALALLGYSQSNERTITRGKLLLLPAAMLCLSLLGVISSFGLNFLPVAAWALGLAPVAAFGARLVSPRNVEYLAASASFRVPGSWLPLALMMAIFLIKYAIGFASARGLSVVSVPAFIGIAAFLLGSLSGAFVARAIGIRRHSSRERRDA
jgi:hypothetical protein